MSDLHPKDAAFPFQYDNGPGSRGMSLRDWFAGQALAGDLATQSDDFGFYDNSASVAESYAIRAYELADAMLKVREQS